MKLENQQHARRGIIIAFLALTLVVLLGFVALAIDIGILAIASSQCQNAADAGAMAATRTLNGDIASNNNMTNAPPAALTIAMANTVLGKPILASQVTIDLGAYIYDSTTQKFVIKTPKPSNEAWSLSTVRVAATIPTFFGKVFGINTMNPVGVATAVHRPRDIAIILDLSGSMRFDSLLGIPHTGDRTKSNNPESVFPQFGHYSDITTAALQNPNAFTTIGSDVFGSANITVDTASGAAIVKDFYKHVAGFPAQLAFVSSADTYATAPDGDNYLKVSGSYVKTVKDAVNSTSINSQFESKGYNYLTGTTFKGYTGGPRYWGKTFFIWPPDPLTTNDWRRKFFFKNDGSTPLNDNTLLWDSTGNWRVPRSSSTNNYYRVNYNAILQWIKNTGPNPFPTRLRSGRILYYDAIPDTISTSPFPPTDLNQRFWKDYIDYVLGLQQDSGTSSPVYQEIISQTGYGDNYTWGTVAINAKPSGADTRYMNYLDNPKRPKLQMWFGPMTMIDFLGNYNLGSIASPNYQKHWWLSGTCHESPLWQLKLGIRGSLLDVQYNHPNDLVTLTMFSSPQNSSGNPSYGRFNRVRSPLGNNYQRMIDSLWYPTVTIDTPGKEIRPYDYAYFQEAPHAMGGTSPAMGFMQAYNQYSNHSSLKDWANTPAPTGEAGGLGRQGAQKLIILETDGMANVTASANFFNGGTYNSYYSIRYPGEYPIVQGTVDTQCYAVVDQLTAQTTASSPGYSTGAKPVLIHCLAFGTLFEPNNNTADKADALTLLQTIQFKGKTQATASESLPSYKLIVGSSDERVAKLKQAFQKIMVDGIQVTLVQ